VGHQYLTADGAELGSLNIPARLVIEGNRQAGDGGEVDDNQEDDGPQA
jgi:hypothetical protein